MRMTRSRERECDGWVEVVEVKLATTSSVGMKHKCKFLCKLGAGGAVLVCKASLAFRSKRLDVAITAISSFVVGKMNIWLEMVIHNNFVRAKFGSPIPPILCSSREWERKEVKLRPVTATCAINKARIRTSQNYTLNVRNKSEARWRRPLSKIFTCSHCYWCCSYSVCSGFIAYLMVLSAVNVCRLGNCWGFSLSHICITAE